MSGSSQQSRWLSSAGWKLAGANRTGLWRLAATATLCAAWVIGCAAGCRSRTILIPSDDSLLRVGPGGAKLRVWYHMKGEWLDSGEPLNIPEGWYLLPPRFVGDE